MNGPQFISGLSVTDTSSEQTIDFCETQTSKFDVQNWPIVIPKNTKLMCHHKPDPPI